MNLPMLRAKPLPPPSPMSLGAEPFPPMPPPFIVRVAMWLRATILRLADLVVPANVAVFDASIGIANTELLGAMARLGIADLLESGPRTASELALQVNVNAEVLHRVLRALASRGLFKLLPDGRFENSRLSRALRGGQLHRAREWCIYFSSPSNVAAWTDFSESLRTGDTAFDRVFGMTVWDWFSAHADEEEMFAHAMMGLTVADAPVIAAAYPFREIQKLCDVGGGRGTLLSELLLRHPHLRGVLCDAPGVLDSAKALLEGRGVRDRVELAAGNFFESVPRGADAYLMKNVLHDWGDDTCRKILSTVRAAMEPGARLVLAEILVERTETRGLGPLADMQMLVVANGGRERGVAEFRALLESTGFSLGRVFPAPTVSVIEGIAR